MSEQRNRSYDKNLLGRFWHESKLWIHLIIMAAGIATAWQVLSGNVAEASKKNFEQDERLSKLDQAITAQAAISARIEQKVDYIREDVQDIKREQK